MPWTTKLRLGATTSPALVPAGGAKGVQAPTKAAPSSMAAAAAADESGAFDGIERRRGAAPGERARDCRAAAAPICARRFSAARKGSSEIRRRARALAPTAGCRRSPTRGCRRPA